MKLPPREPLKISKRQPLAISMDGKPMKLVLGPDPNVHYVLVARTSTYDGDKDEAANGKYKYTWSATLTAPTGGGIINGTEQSGDNHVAPESGYLQEYHFDTDTRRESDYFVKFADNTYALIYDFDVDGSYPRGITLGSAYNPKAGSRNLTCSEDEINPWH